MSLYFLSHQITTKKGAQMAFAKLNDMDGQIDLTFFPKIWETIRGQLEDGSVYAFRGKVDGSRDTPSLIVDQLKMLSRWKPTQPSQFT